MRVLSILNSLFRRAINNKYSLLIYIIIPSIGILIPVLMYSKVNDTFNIVVVDEDKSYFSNSVLNSLIKDIDADIEYMNIVDGKSKVISGEKNLLVFIPKNFKENLLNDNAIKVDLIYMKEKEEVFKIKELINSYIENMKIILNSVSKDEDKFKEIYQEISYVDYSVESQVIYDKRNDLSLECLGFIILFMMIITNSSLSNIIQDRNNNIQKRFLYGNIKASEYIGAQILWSLSLSLVQFFTIINIFNISNIDIKISNWEFFCIFFIVWIVSTSFSIFSISFCKNEEQLTIINTIIVFPTCMLSGCLWPIDVMKDVMQRLSIVLPQRHIIILMEQMQIGQNIYTIIISCIYIILFSLFLLLIGIIRIDNNDFKEII